MKKTLLVFLLFASFSSQSQNCAFFLPFITGKGVQLQTYNSRGKITGTVDYIIDSVSSADSTKTAFIRSSSLDQKGNEISVMEYRYKCNGTELRIDPLSMINPEHIEPYKEMEFEVENDDVIIPSSMKTNQKLKDAGCLMKIYEENQKRADMNFKCTNRKIISIDSVTTSLGIFSCYKISSETILTVTTMIVPYIVEMNINEYFSENIGVVRVENFDKKGKLLGYSVLSKIY